VAVTAVVVVVVATAVAVVGSATGSARTFDSSGVGCVPPPAPAGGGIRIVRSASRPILANAGAATSAA
jgi:hypothetical protein